jgi:hypothetical protein
MTTTAELLEQHNEFAEKWGKKPLKSWKQSKDALRERIDAMRAEVADDVIGDDEPEAPKPIKLRGAMMPSVTIGALVKELLLMEDGLSYDLIEEAVKREFPEAKTTRRSIASVAADLRRKGVEVPMRKKGRPA